VRASRSASSVSVPGVTRRTTSRRTTALDPPRFLASAGSSICSQTATRKPFADQRQKVVFGGMNGDAAHGDVFAPVLAAFGQRDVQRLRRGNGVIEEHLVEIAHAVEQKRVGVTRLDLQILRHHWRYMRVHGSPLGPTQPTKPVPGIEAQFGDLKGGRNPHIAVHTKHTPCHQARTRKGPPRLQRAWHQVKGRAVSLPGRPRTCAPCRRSRWRRGCSTWRSFPRTGGGVPFAPS
jgi:hypothetical protein